MVKLTFVTIPSTECSGISVKHPLDFGSQLHSGHVNNHENTITKNEHYITSVPVTSKITIVYSPKAGSKRKQIYVFKMEYCE